MVHGKKPFGDIKKAKRKGECNMPNTQFIILLVISILCLLGAFLTFMLVLAWIKNAKRDRADLERKLGNAVGTAMNSAVGNAAAELERRLSERLKELSDTLYRYNEQTKNDYERFKNALSEGIAASMRETTLRLAEGQTAAAEKISAEQKAFAEKQLAAQNAFADRLTAEQKLFSERLTTEQRSLADRLNAEQKAFSDRLTAGQEALEKQLSDRLKAQAEQSEVRSKHFEAVNAERLAAMDASLKLMTERNEKQLDAIRGVVDEKLQETLTKQISENFKLVDERLKQVYQGLGEMQTLASGVGDLKKVLSNVKTRGTLGEIQLGAILGEVLAPEQYECNFDAGKQNNERVEFAIKLPNDGREAVYLPIDSKFPADIYSKLCDAYDSGEDVAAAQKNLRDVLLKCAKDIKDKYINPPRTTDFAIMFLPTEGLYAEAVRLGLIEELQTRFRVNLSGPSTMAALLNSLQMGFRTLAIQKRSSEVWDLLAQIKKEFGKFDDVLRATQKSLEKANNDLETLVGVRTRQICRTLKKVETLPQTDPTGEYKTLAEAIINADDGEG